MLFFSTIGVCVSLFIFGGYFVAKSNGISVSSLSFVPFIGMLMYGVMNSVGFAPISQVILGEIFPMQFKEIVNSLCSIVFYISTFLMLMLYPYMRDALGLGAEFWIYSAFALLCTIFSYFYVIETKGKTLNEIIAELNVL
ncbi:hypothetical protein HHI36_010693 [Cryptolaemus montrouzieri]|uniref:Major facilitator superfamily (MFS) profile domain-containing protein n=1 Tax=Cryptolaemus montrouzieri TaxID=559131 RepID=A0ABD2MJI7_9CUCU